LCRPVVPRFMRGIQQLNPQTKATPLDTADKPRYDVCVDTIDSNLILVPNPRFMYNHA
jgi:hypothetical protein